jgi:hypothetical protein
MTALDNLTQKLNANWWPIIIFVLGQAVALFLWGAHIDAKTVENANRIADLERRIDILDSVGGRQVHRLNARIEALERLTERMDLFVRTLPVLDERTQVLRSQANEYATKLNELSKVYRLQSDSSQSVPDPANDIAPFPPLPKEQ